MTDIFSPHWLQQVMHTYGLWMLFALVMLESMGLPMPGETALISAAVYAGATHSLAIPWVILVAAAAAILGDNTGYAVGRTLGLSLVRRYGCHIGLSPSRLRIGQYLFLEHGGKIVFFGRFIALLRTFAAVLAGVNRMRWVHFLAMNALGAVAWATLFGGGAYLFGDQMRSVAGPASAALLGAALLALVAGFLFLRHHEQALASRAEAAIGTETSGG
jgi:membrane protein DedA with SNARE-associated domain